MASENAEGKPSLDEQLKEMRSFVVDMLIESSQFLSVEPLAEYGRGSVLSRESKRNIRAVKHPEYAESGQPEEYLVICNVDAMPARLFADKLVEASGRGIYTVHLCTRSVEEGDGRMFFRKDKLEEERSPGTEKQAKNKEAYEHYSVADRENFRKLRDFEFFINALTDGNSNYYQHPTERLSEGIRKFTFTDIVPRGTWYDAAFGEDVPYEIPLMTKLPVELEKLNSGITLAPASSNVNYNALDYWLRKGKAHLDHTSLLAGEFIPTDIDQKAYRYLQSYQRMLIGGLTDAEIAVRDYDLLERIAIMNEGMSERELTMANAVFPEINLRSLE